MRLRSTSPVFLDGEGFARTSVIVECSAEERRLLECLLDEYHPNVDVFSLRDRAPNLVELGVQLESARRRDAHGLLRRRLRSLVEELREPEPREVSLPVPSSQAIRPPAASHRGAPVPQSASSEAASPIPYIGSQKLPSP
ncbi:MAG TPA: hypothetical protein VLT81_05285 [Chondromyces sp.]|nr:hypothetical protein [Chondromyces sp.]